MDNGMAFMCKLNKLEKVMKPKRSHFSSDNDVSKFNQQLSDVLNDSQSLYLNLDK
jgi:hypothetical protein